MLKFLSILLLILSSCSILFHDHPEPNDTWPYDKKMIEGETYVFSDSTYFLSAHTIPPNVTIRVKNNAELGIFDTLYVCEGVTFEMGSNAQIRTIQNNGKAILIFKGRADRPIVLKPTDSLGTWGGVVITEYSDSNNVFVNTIFDKAFTGISSNRTNALSIDSIVIKNCIDQGISSVNNGIRSLTNSQFYNNGQSDLLLDSSSLNSVDLSNTFTTGITIQDGMMLDYTFPPTTYKVIGSKFHFRGTNFVNKGTHFYIDKSIEWWVINGSLHVNGGEENPIYFKPLSSSFWPGIHFSNSSGVEDKSVSLLNNVSIDSASTGLTIINSNVKLTNSAITNFNKGAILMYDSSSSLQESNNTGFDTTDIIFGF